MIDPVIWFGLSALAFFALSEFFRHAEMRERERDQRERMRRIVRKLRKN